MAAIGNKPGSGKIEKKVKVKLTKEQKLYVKNLVTLQNRIQVCREYSSLWMQFFRFFAEIHEDHEITAADEKAFFQCMTQLARMHFLFVEMMGDAFEGDKDLIKIMVAAVSLNNIKAMQENTRDKLELDWHNQFLAMNMALGRLLRLLPESKLTPLTEVLANLRKADQARAAEKAAVPAG